MQNGAAPVIAVSGNYVTITEPMTRFGIVVLDLPDRCLFYKRPPNLEPGYASGRAWSYPKRGPSWSETSADHFQHEFNRVNHETDGERLEAMAILSLLHDMPAIPAQIDIGERRMKIGMRLFPDRFGVPGS